MLNDRAIAELENTTSSSFACNLKQWHGIMQAYENGGHAYHATLPTDALTKFRDAILETKAYGFDKVCNEQIELGQKVRALLESKGIKSVAADGFKAPGVVVSYTSDADMQSGKKFAAQGLQAAAGVPLQCDEGPDYQTFRIGLFGLDKLHNIDRTVANLESVINKIL
jgi:aspartate aminotransferase-like enzyme